MSYKGPIAKSGYVDSSEGCLIEGTGDEIDRVQSAAEDNRLRDYLYEAISVSRSGHCAASIDNQVLGPG